MRAARRANFNTPKTKNPPARLFFWRRARAAELDWLQLPAAPEGVSVVVRIIRRIHLAGDGFWLREIMTSSL
jgi:hypothetical protein